MLPRFWEIPELVEINRLPMWATLNPYPTLKQALARKSLRWVRSLNGDLDFRCFDLPESVKLVVSDKAFCRTFFDIPPAPQ